MSREVRLSVPEIGRLLKLVTTVADLGECSPAEAIHRMEELSLKDQRGKRKHTVLAEFISRLRRLRMRRNDLVGAPLFRDPAWDMLLGLFVAHERGQPVSVSSLCHDSGVPPTTALRYLSQLEKHGLAVREEDSRDTRRQLVFPTEKALQGIARAGSLLIDQSRELEPDSHEQKRETAEEANGK